MKNKEKEPALSKRMEAVAGLITGDGTLADVGTDHGYIPIAMVLRGHVRKAIAMDVRTGPLERATEHITEYGLEGKIETRLSDGVAALAQKEADSIIVAGMGGELVIHILEEGESVCKSAKELILQPQSAIDEVRRFLREHGYLISDEEMVKELGKYYPMMRVVPKEDAAFLPDEVTTRMAEQAGLDGVYLTDLYGPVLIKKSHPVLQEFLRKQERQYTEILDGLRRQPDSQKICERKAEITGKLEYNRLAQDRMKYKILWGKAQ